MCLSKNRGGLGIGHIIDKNNSLLAKWAWRFSGEDNPLWKRVMCARYGVDKNALLWNWQVPDNASHFVKAVSKLFVAGSKTEKILSEGFQVAFPRIFALASNKHGKVSENGGWQGSNWFWEVPLRRQPFDWEGAFALWLMLLLVACFLAFSLLLVL
ncbi:hypothetical protein Q3G72_024567 [Acer saccharum]|nr:hypothetical protein Q3G72_024567 [Acer saccharum]